MLKFIRPNFVGGFSVVSEIVPVPPSMFKRMGLWWNFKRWYKTKFFGLEQIAYYERRLRLSPKALGKRFAFYDEAKVLEKYPEWFEVG